MAKALLFLRASGTDKGGLLKAVTASAEALHSRHPQQTSTLRVMESLAEDALANRQAPEHVADVTVEIKTSPGLPLGDQTGITQSVFQ